MASTLAEGSHVTKGTGGLPRVVVSHSSGATLEVYLWGATITSFKTSAGQELLFMSSKAIFDGVKAIRGGIPIVFPQFGTQGPLPQHGFARNSEWTLDSVGDGTAELSLLSSDATRAVWPHAFELKYRIMFDNERLITSLDVTNPRDSPAPFSFDALLHTYLHAGPGDDAISKLRISGLKGTKYVSKVDGGAEFEEAGDAIVIDREVDRVYQSTPAAVVVTGITSGGAAGVAGAGAGAATADAGGAAGGAGAGAAAASAPAAGTAASGAARPPFTSVTVKRTGSCKDAPPALRLHVVSCPLDVVVWNAWVERSKAIADLGDEDYKRYVCVEPGRVSAATAAAPANKELHPGHVWTLRQELVLGHE